MVLKKKKKIKVLDKNSIFSVFKDGLYGLDVPLQTIKNSINGFIDDFFDNELLFFKWEIDILETKKFLTCYYVDGTDIEKEIKDNMFNNIDSYLSDIELIEYAFLVKTEEKYYLFFFVKSLLGYNNTILTRYISDLNSDQYLLYLSNSKMEYVKSRKKAKSYFYFMISQYKDYHQFFENSCHGRICYTKQAIGYSYSKYIGNTLGLIVLNENKPYKDPDISTGYTRYGKAHLKGFSKLNKKRVDYINDPFKSMNSDLLALTEYNVFSVNNDFKLISTRNVCEQSIINLWVIYMRLNGFYIKDGQIYEKFNSEREPRYISTLDYLKINMDLIIHSLKDVYYQQLSSYPIELKVMPYLESAYTRVSTSPYYYLPDDYNLEDQYLFDKDLFLNIREYRYGRRILRDYHYELDDLEVQLIYSPEDYKRHKDLIG